MAKTLERILIEAGEIDRVYTGSTSLYLWRALPSAVQTTNPLYPDFRPRTIRPGEIRAPDVTLRTFRGVEYVIARVREGTSLFDRPAPSPARTGRTSRSRPAPRSRPG